MITIFDLAVQYLGDKEQAEEWLNTPNKDFHNNTPDQIMKDSGGIMDVRDYLIYHLLEH